MARHLSRSDRARMVNVWGKALGNMRPFAWKVAGMGKTAMLAEFTRFCIYPGLFSFKKKRKVLVLQYYYLYVEHVEHTVWNICWLITDSL